MLLLLLLLLVPAAALLIVILRFLVIRGPGPLLLAPVAPFALPKHAIPVVDDQHRHRLRDELIGTLMLASIGGFGLNQTLRALILLANTGLEGVVGSILVIECDAQERERFQREVPACFADRIVYGSVPDYSGGMANRPVGWVYDRIREWGVPIRRAAHEVIDRHRRLNQGRSPSLVLLLQSLGGQAPLGIAVLDELQALAQTSLIVAMTGLPRHLRLRERWLELKAFFEARGCAGWIILDNLVADSVTNDYAGAALPVVITAAALREDAPTALNNTFALALAEQPGGVLVYQAISTSVVAFPIMPPPTTGPRYWVHVDTLVPELHRVLQRLVDGQGLWSAELAIYEERTSTFDFLVASLTDDGLRRTKDELLAGLRLDAEQRQNNPPAASPRFGEPNYELALACVSVPINPDKPTCPILAVRLTSVHDATRFLEEIVAVPAARRTVAGSRYLPPGRPTASRDMPPVVREVPDYVPPTAAD